MSDEPEVVPLSFLRHEAVTVTDWPERTVLSERFLEYAHVHHATVRGDVVSFRLGNGEADYRLRRDLPAHRDGIIADLIPGAYNDRASLAARARKFNRSESEGGE